MADKTKGADLDIVELKIKMHTNKDTIEELTADKIKIDTKIGGTYPFLCTNYRYNKNLLSLKTLPERIGLFFDRAKLRKFVNDSKMNSKQNVTQVVDDKELEQKIEDKIKNLAKLKLINAGITLNAKIAVTDINKIKNINKQNIIDNLDETPKSNMTSQSDFLNFLSRLSRKRGVNNAVAKENIIIMLNALFPISFPIQDQVALMDDDTNFDLMNMVKRFFKSKEYVYLNIGKTSTVIQVIWLNTVSSNPTYYQLYQRIKKYYKMIFNYIDENITDPIIQTIMEDDTADDSTKIQKIKAYVDKIIKPSLSKPPPTGRGVASPVVTPLPDKNVCILFFLLLNDDDPKLYNDFITTYVNQFVRTQSTNGYSYHSNYDSNLKDQFFKSLQKISEVELRNAHMKEIADYLPPKRVSSNKKIVSELKDYSKFFDFYDNNKKQYSGIDKIGDGKYEIHIGVAVVGGKVTQSNYKFACKYNSQRLGNNLNYLIKNTDDDADENVHLYGYIDLENVKDPTEYTGTVNSILKKDEKKTSNGDNRDYRDGMFNQTRFNGGLKKTRSYRVFNKKTRKYYGDM